MTIHLFFISLSLYTNRHNGIIMREKVYPEFSLDSFNLINFLFRYWKVFIITGIVAFIVSVIVSLTITPKFMSTVNLYPASNISESGARLFSDEPAVISFGDEQSTEKVLQLLQSDMIKEFLIEKYSLFSHYDIPDDARYRYTMMNNIMKKNISFRKTRYMSVQLSVLDTDPHIAASIANDIAALIDTTFNQMLRDAANKYLVVLEKEYSRQQNLIRAYEDSLTGIMKKSDRISSAYGRGESTTRADNLAEYGAGFMRFSESHEQAVEDLGLIRQSLTEARLSASENLPYVLMINKAREAEKKAFPKRSVIVLASVFASLIFLFLVLMIIDGLVIPSRKK